MLSFMADDARTVSSKGNLFSITGVFHQEGYGIIPSGGYFLRDDSIEGGLISGLMADVFGMASINGEYLSDSEIMMEKQYHHHEVPIEYSLRFNSEKNLWEGEYRARLSLHGRAIFDIKPAIDGLPPLELIAVLKSPEEAAEELLESLINEGFVKEIKDPETGESYIEPVNLTSDYEEEGTDEDLPF